MAQIQSARLGPGVEQALADALDRVAVLVDSLPLPALAAPSPCAGWSVGDVVRHVLAVTDKFTRFAAGETDEPHASASTVPDAGLDDAFRESARASCAAWSSPPTGAICRLPFGEFDRTTAAGINLFDAIVHGADIAYGAGIAYDVDDASAEMALVVSQLLVGDDAHFGRRVETAPGASPLPRLLALTGRQPNDPIRLRAALAAYEPVDAREVGDVQRVLAALDAGDVWSRSAPLHVTASALILHPPTGRVLLRWHPHMQNWMQVGGHFDPGESDPWLVALREAREETGLTDLAALPRVGTAPVQVVIVPVPERVDEPAHVHADIRYVFVTEHPDDTRVESPDAALRWLPIDDAVVETVQANLAEFLRRAACHM